MASGIRDFHFHIVPLWAIHIDDWKSNRRWGGSVGRLCVLVSDGDLE